VPIGALPSWAADALTSGEPSVPFDEMPIEGEEGEDPLLAFRMTLGSFVAGVTVITTTAEEQVHGMMAEVFMSVSLRPPLVEGALAHLVARITRMYRGGDHSLPGAVIRQGERGEPPTWWPESRLRCMALSRERVKRALRSEPELAWRVLEVLAGRIRG
jgi:flavin reductase (DIM6/NTAB) family NADH-FMN oxidoreductase RutF